MTGCPNGCARPYIAEIGFVGRNPGKYNLHLGGNADGSRLNRLYKEDADEETILSLPGAAVCRLREDPAARRRVRRFHHPARDRLRVERRGKNPAFFRGGKQPLFEKSGAKTFYSSGPVSVKPARPRIKKVFLLLFVHKKKSSSF